MADIPEALVKKAAPAVFGVWPQHDDTEPWEYRIARAVLAAVWDDLEEVLWREGSMHRLFDAARAQARSDIEQGLEENG